MSDDFQFKARAVTDGEVDSFHRNGWVKLPQLISSDAAARLREAAIGIREEIEANPEMLTDANGERHLTTPQFHALVAPGLFVVRNMAVDPFDTFATSLDMGKAAHRLINRARLGNDRIGTVLLDAALLCKSPESEEGGAATDFHQDDADNLGIDRVGMLQFWIALDHITPDQGTLTFFEGSHRLGCLGGHRKTLLDEYPAIAALHPPTPPLAYAPGDATVHHQHMVHGAGRNRTERARWAFTAAYMAADCIIKPEAETQMGRHGPYERFPAVYMPAAART